MGMSYYGCDAECDCYDCMMRKRDQQQEPFTAEENALLKRIAELEKKHDETMNKFLAIMAADNRDIAEAREKTLEDVCNLHWFKCRCRISQGVCLPCKQKKEIRALKEKEDTNGN